MDELGHSGTHRVLVPGVSDLQPRGVASCACGWQSPAGLEFSLVVRLAQVHLDDARRRNAA